MRLVPAVLVVAAATALLMAALLPPGTPAPGLSRSPASSPDRGATPAGTPGPSPAPTPGRSFAGAIEAASYVGPTYDLNVVSEPTEWTGQAKVWFHDGSWWALMAAEGTGHVHIHELHWESQRWIDSGVVVDERSFVRFDVVSDGSSLYIVGSGSRNSASHATRVTSYLYDPDARQYLLQPDFPRTVTTGGVGVVTLARAPDGALWMAYVARLRVHLMVSETGGVTWTPEFQLPVPDADRAADAAVIVATPAGVAVAWTELRADRLHVATHADGAAADAWAIATTTVDGLVYGEDELSARSAADGTILVVLRTSLDRVDNRNPDAPQLVLTGLRNGEWRQSVVARVRDGHTGAQLVVHDAHREVYVIAEVAGDIYAKRAMLETLSFSSGAGLLVARAPEAPATTPSPAGSPAPAGESAEPIVPQLGNVTTTRQDAGTLSEILILATDDETGRYTHGIITPPDGRTPPVAEGHMGPPPDGVTSGLRPGTLTFQFRDSFTPFEPGPGTVSGWETRDDPVDEVMRIAEPSQDDPALHLVPNAEGDGPRACKSFPPSTSGIIIVEATVQVRGVPDSDATITTLRSAEGEVASVRFGEPGTFRYFNGDERITSTVTYQPGAWYRSVLTLDFATQTYDWTIAPLGVEAPILALTDAPLRVPAISVGQVCMQSANELPGGAVEMYVDDVSVAVGPGG